MNEHRNLVFQKRQAFIILLVGATAISFAPILVRLSHLEPIATAFYRILFALPIFWAWILYPTEGGSKTLQTRSSGHYLLLGVSGIFFAGDLAFWHWSIKLTSIANATLLANSAPIFVTCGAFIIFREKFSKLFLVGLVLALFGIVLLMGNSYELNPHFFLGDLFGVTAAIFYAAYILSVGSLRRVFSTSTIMGWSGVASCLVLFPVLLLFDEAIFATTAVAWGILICLALISHAGGQSLIAYSLAHLPAAFGSVGLLLQPVLATILAWFIFSEALSLYQVVGGIIVLIGIAFARRGTW